MRCMSTAAGEDRPMTHATPFDAVVLIGFGGPTSPEEIRPFLDRVLEGRPVPRARYEDVVRHYERIGGRSPFNELTQRQADALAGVLRIEGVEIPVRVGLRHAAPFIEETLRDLAAEGARHLLGIVLAAHESEASWERYVESAEEARRRIGAGAPTMTYAHPSFDHPLLVRAHAQRVREAHERMRRDTFAGMTLIFTAHSIPQAMADRGPYVRELVGTAALVAEAVGAPDWHLAYQSRSGSPSERWLEPDVCQVLRRLPSGSGRREAVVAPIGFVCDHVEVLYDLDVEAAEVAATAGVRMERARALNDHPDFVAVLAELVTGRPKDAGGAHDSMESLSR
ncbi:ferrochelatase [bacterium]|nr:MAG: ferrochelatase [bacterium]